MPNKPSVQSRLAQSLVSACAWFGVAIAMAGAGALSGCSRAGESSKVRLQFPDWSRVQEIERAHLSKVSTLAFDQSKVTMVVINITGPGLSQPVLFNWENHDNANAVPPQDLSLDVPRGAGRLVQAMAIYEGAGTMQFYYADSVTDMNTDVTSVALTLTNAAATSNAVEGRIVGRYLSGMNQGYTGAFHYRFSPPGGKPAMVVQQGEIFSGWITDLFSLSEPLITYTKPDGSPLFTKADGSALNITNSTLDVFAAAVPARVVRLHVPAGYANEAHVYGQYDMIAKAPQRILIGFFGPGAESDQKICLESPSVLSGASDVDRLYKNLNADGLGTSAPVNPVKWSGKVTPALASVPDYVFVAPITIGSTTFKGGLDQNDTASCASVTTDSYRKFLKIDGTKALRHEALAGFMGPFRRPTNASTDSDRFTTILYDSSGQRLGVQWELLPGVAPDLAGMSVFYRTVATSSEVYNDSALRSPGSEGYRCDEFRGSGFSPAFSEIQVAIGTTQAVIEGIATSDIASRTQVIVCPRGNDGRLFKTAAMNVYSSGGSGGGSSTAARLVLVGPDHQTTAFPAYNGVCTPIFIRGENSSGQLGQIPQGTQVTLAGAVGGIAPLTAGTFEFFDNAVCIGTPLGMPWGGMSGLWGERQLFVKSSTSGANTATFSINDSSGGSSPLTAGSIAVNFSDPTTADRVKLSMPTAVKAYSCQLLQLQTRYLDTATGKEIVAAYSSDLVTVTLPAIAGLTYYDQNDFDCAGTPLSGSPQVALGYDGTITKVTTFVRFKYTGTTAFSVLPSITSGPLAGRTAAVTVASVSQPGAITQLGANGWNTVTTGTCAPYLVQLMDANYSPSPVVSTTNAGDPVTVSLGSTPVSLARFYATQADCAAGTSEIHSTSITLGSTGVVVFAKPSTAGNISLDVSSVAPALNSSYSINVTVPPPSQLKIVLPGETFSNGSVTGLAQEQAKSVPFSIQIYALRPDGSVATDFSGALLSLSSTGSLFVPITSPVTIINGVASAQVRYDYRNPAASHFGSPNMIQASAATDSGSINGSSSYVMVAPDQNPAQLKMFSTATSMPIGACQPVFLAVQNATQTMSGFGISSSTRLTAPLTVDLSVASGSAAQFSLSADCSTAQSTLQITIPAGDSSKVVYVLFPGGSSSTLQAASTLGTTQLGLTLGGVVSTVANVTVLGDYQIEAAACQAYALVQIDGASIAATRSSPTTAQLSSGLMDFYSDPWCNTPLAGGSLTIPANQTSVRFFGRAHSSGSGSLSTWVSELSVSGGIGGTLRCF